MSKLLYLYIKNFRGIRCLKWKVSGDFVCLVGPGDSTKSTILDAIETVLLPRWRLSTDDTDFYNLNPDNSLAIEATLGDVPTELLTEERFGLQKRGWTDQGTIRDEPAPEDEPVLSIRFSMDDTLEPKWVVFNDRIPEGRRIGSADRQRLGQSRLGPYVDWHLAWGRRSALTRFSQGAKDSTSGTLAKAARAAVQAVSYEDLGELCDIAEEVEELGQEFGVAPRTKLVPHLDLQSLSVNASSLALHDGEIPLRRAGLGSRRLLTMALQKALTTNKGILLVDELEYGLEPFRVRQVLSLLRENARPAAGQVFVTTHSPVAIRELKIEELRVVSSRGDGVTNVRSVQSDLRRIIRSNPEALLGRNIVVCEGATEIGLCRFLDRRWSRKGNRSFAYLGVVLADGGGSSTPSRALGFAKLGYQVVLLGDSDVPIPAKHLDDLEAQGVKVILWAGEVSLEERFSQDLPWNGVVDMVRLAMEVHGLQSVRDALATTLELQPKQLGDEPEQWQEVAPKKKLRAKIGQAARAKHWFKRVDLGERLAKLIEKHETALVGTPLALGLEELREWIHGR